MSDPIRILLIDDDPQFRQLVKLVLRKVDGLEIVAEAADGRAGVEQAEAVEPDVVLLDLMMPGMDGFEALPLILQAHPQTSIVVLTALDADEAEEGVLFGAAGFVEKRYIAERLEAVIRGVGGHTP